MLTSVGIASLAGPLIAGAVVDRSGSYQWGIGFALMSGMAGFAVVMPLRLGAAAAVRAAVASDYQAVGMLLISRRSEILFLPLESLCCFG